MGIFYVLLRLIYQFYRAISFLAAVLIPPCALAALYCGIFTEIPAHSAIIMGLAFGPVILWFVCTMSIWFIIEFFPDEEKVPSLLERFIDNLSK